MAEENKGLKKIGASGPGLIYLQLLENCNLRCSMCYEWGEHGAYHSKTKLRRLEKEKIKEIIIQSKEHQPHFWLYGGEPLLYPDLEEILQCIQENGCTAEMDTNGVLLKENAETLIKTSLQMIHVSLDGPEVINDRQRGKGVFKKVIEGISYLSELKKKYNSEFPRISINTTITEKNYDAVCELYETCLGFDKINHVSLELQAYISKEKAYKYKEFIREKFGIENPIYIDGFVADPVHFKPIDYSVLVQQIEHMKKVFHEKGIELNCYPKIIDYENCSLYFSGKWEEMKGNKKHCVFPWVYAEITAGGDVAPCHAFYDLTFGNVYEQSLFDIWNSENYQKFRKECRKGLLPNCSACCLYYHNKY